jgi:hypothetical protein
MTSNRFSLSILRIRNFRLLVLTRVFTIMAMQAQAVVVGWQIYSLTKSPLLLGLRWPVGGGTWHPVFAARWPCG